MTPPQVLPYGLWPSPISALMDGQSARLLDVQWDSTGRTLVWLERRNARHTLIVKPEDGACYELVEDLEPYGGVGYGGGEFTVRDGLIIYAERGGRLVRRRIGHDLPRSITPVFGRTASPTISPDGRQVLYCWSDGITDALALVDSQGETWPVKLRSHSGFFMQPAWHPFDKKLAWIEWDHPYMPWDETRLMYATSSGPGILDKVIPLVAEPEKVVCQPLFSPDGNWLSSIESNGEWEDLVLTHLPDLRRRTLVHGEGFHLCIPAWVQGLRSYGWSSDSRRIYYLRNFGGQASLWVVDVESSSSRQIPITPYTWVRQLAVSPAGEQVAFIASAPGVPDRVVRWDGERLHVEARSQPEALGPEWFAEPQPFSWPAADGTTVHGLFFPPTNPQARGDGLPPCILHIHGGPSSLDPQSFDPEVAYFTSRGYALVRVNYRGSSGYGRCYLRALYGRWGEYDVEDAAGAARALIEQDRVDPGKLIIMGGSAGGYTVLNGLIRYPQLFKAGVAKYPVSNLFTIDLDTHKFEAHYTSQLVGKLPQETQRFRDWSPIFHVDQLRSPLALFQGDADTAVVPAQAEEMVAALRTAGVPHLYKLYPGEGHGFRKTENIVDYYQSTERFLQQYVLFAL